MGGGGGGGGGEYVQSPTGSAGNGTPVDFTPTLLTLPNIDPLAALPGEPGIPLTMGEVPEMEPMKNSHMLDIN